MLKRLSIILTDFMCNKGAVEPARRAIFIYGFQLTLSTLCSLISICIISAIVKKPLSVLVFFIAFFWVRLFSGGFHARTYLRCFLLTNMVYLLIVLGAELLFRTSIPIILGVQITAGIIVCLLTPIRHKNHPLSEAVYIRNQKVSRALVIVLELLFPLTTILVDDLTWIALFSASLMAVAILMIIPKIQERRNRYE